MKKTKILFVLLAVVALCCFAGCSKGEAKYTISLAEYAEEVSFGSEFTLPEAVVRDAKHNVISQTVKVRVVNPNGDEIVVTNGSFVASVLGSYTLHFSTQDAALKTITVKCVDVQLPAATDVAVDQDGKITFSCAKAVRFMLFVDGVSVGEVKSGDNISAFVKVGGCVVEVQNQGGLGYIVSEKSAPVSLDKKARIEDVQIVENIITFSEKSGERYQLFNCGIYQADVHSGEDVSAYFTHYKNEFSVRAVGKSGVLNGDLSRSVNFNVHPEMNDFSIDEKGELTFTAYHGYVYNLYRKTENSAALIAENIFPEQNFYEEIDSVISDKSETFFIEILEESSNKNGSVTKTKSNEFSVQRLSPVTGLALDDELKISFDNGDDLYCLIVNGEERALVENGEDITVYLDGGDTNTLSLVAVPTQIGYWKSLPSAPISKAVPQNYKSLEEKTFSGTNGAYFAKDALSYQKYNAEGELADKGNATILKGKSGSIFRLNRTLNLSGKSMTDSFIRFQPVSEDGNYHLKSLKIRLISVADSENFVTIEFYMGANGRTYARASYQQSEACGASVGSFQMSETGADVYSLGVSLSDEAVNLSGVFDVAYRTTNGVYAFYLQNARLNYGEYLSSPGVHCIRHLNWDHVNNQPLPSDVWEGLSGEAYMEIEFAAVDEYCAAELAVISVNGASVYGNEVHVSETINGSVTAPGYALSGENVSVRLLPDDEYDVYSYGVYSETGKLISLADRFTMPEEDVFVRATFRSARTYKVERDVTGGGCVWAAESADGGETVKINILPNRLWRVRELKVVSASRKNIELSNENTFVMPEETVQIIAIFEEISVPGNIFSGKGEIGKIEDGYAFEKVGEGEYAAMCSGMGTLLQGKEGCRFRLNETINVDNKTMEDSLVKFQTISVDGAYNLQGLKVKLISARDEENYVTIEFVTKSDGHTYAIAYFPGSSDIGGNMSEGQSKPGAFSADGADLYYASRLSLQNNMFGGDAKRFFELSYRTEGAYVFYLIGDNLGAWSGDGEIPGYHTVNHLDVNDITGNSYSPDIWSGLSGDVYLEFEFTSVVGGEAAVVVTDIQGTALNAR